MYLIINSSDNFPLSGQSPHAYVVGPPGNETCGDFDDGIHRLGSETHIPFPSPSTLLDQGQIGIYGKDGWTRDNANAISETNMTYNFIYRFGTIVTTV